MQNRPDSCAAVPFAGKLRLRCRPSEPRGVARGVPSDSSWILYRSSCGALKVEALLGVRIVPLSLRW